MDPDNIINFKYFTPPEIAIDYEPHPSGSAVNIIAVHGVTVSFGSFTWFRVNNYGISIQGDNALKDRLIPHIKALKKANEISDREYIHDESLVDIASLTSIVGLALEITMEHFRENPDKFCKWYIALVKLAANTGAQEKAKEIREVIGLSDLY